MKFALAILLVAVAIAAADPLPKDKEVVDKDKVVDPPKKTRDLEGEDREGRYLLTRGYYGGLSAYDYFPTRYVSPYVYSGRYGYIY